MNQNTSSLSRVAASPAAAVAGGPPVGPGTGGCAAAGCDRPPGWTDAHHLRHWVHGGPTSLDNLVLLCRTHHVAVHEGGWRLARDPASGRVVLTPPAWDQPRCHPQGHAPPAA